MRTQFIPNRLAVIAAIAGVSCFGDASAQVGIGTTSPTNMLHVVAPANPLRLDGLQTGTSGDSLLSVSGGVVKRVTISGTGAIIKAGNGLTKTNDSISLGGTLTRNTTIAAGDSALIISGASMGKPEGDAVLSVINTPAGALTSGTSAFASEHLMNYNGGGTGLIQIPQVVGATRGRTISNSETFQAQGANFEARVTGGGNQGATGDFHAVGSTSQGTSTVSNVDTLSTLVGVQAAAGYFGPSLTHNWDVIGVDAYTFYGRVSSRRTVGGHFDGNGGVTSIGLIGTIDDVPYTTFADTELAGKRIGMVAANRVGSLIGGIAPGVTDFALYGIGDVRFTEGDVVVGDVNATTGFNDAASAALQVNSTTQGFLPPRMTESQADAISNKAEGLMVYVTTVDVAGGPINGKGWYGWNGTAWEKLNP